VIDMILKVALAQRVCDYNRQEYQKPKNSFSNKKKASFASVLRNTIKLSK